MHINFGVLRSLHLSSERVTAVIYVVTVRGLQAYDGFKSLLTQREGGISVKSKRMRRCLPCEEPKWLTFQTERKPCAVSLRQQRPRGVRRAEERCFGWSTVYKEG